MRSNRLLFILLGLTILLVIGFLFIVLSSLFSSSSPTTSSPTPIPSGQQTFRTSPTPTLTVEQLQEGQTKADKEYADYFKQVDEDYPWFSNFPLKGNGYFLYFDLNTKRFGANIYPQKSSSETIAAQTTRLQQTVLSRLQAFDIDTNTYPIDWHIVEQ